MAIATEYVEMACIQCGEAVQVWAPVAAGLTAICCENCQDPEVVQ
jgi:hypothetical protein